jgi:response regulator RpfG family c-di-GMP phosphodiesterase
MTSQISRTAKVLLVDDEANIVRSITRLLLEETDLEVVSANSGAQGLELLASHPDVALILSDQRMPGMSGAEFLQKARVLVPDAVRMVLTGYADMSATMDAINKGGASRYLTKPWDDDLLRSSVREGVGQYLLVHENRRLTALVEQQNLELSEWNQGLKGRVMQQTATIRSQNAELKERNLQIGETFRQTILAFSRLIELHSSRLQEHTRNVTELSVNTATDLGLAPEEIETIRTAALLHDVGVIGIPTRILDKRMAAMSQDELQIFLPHAVRGQTALDAVRELRGAGLLIRHHHERYDGLGSPDGIAGTTIPLGSRILAFADFVDREMDEERGEPAVQALFSRAAKALGNQLDPALLPVMEPHIRALYGPARFPLGEFVEKELRPKQLLAGMTVTRNLYNDAGKLLLIKGDVLDADSITTVLHHYRIAPPSGGVFVDWRSSASGACGGGGAQGEHRAERHANRPIVAGERELPPGQLLEGMQITRPLYSDTGLLLLTAGTVLDANSIASVARYYTIDPPPHGVFVSRPPAEP